jgi:hypothetical protein
MEAITSSPEHPVVSAGIDATSSVVAEVANHPVEATRRRTESCTFPRYRLKHRRN